MPGEVLSGVLLGVGVIVGWLGGGWCKAGCTPPPLPGGRCAALTPAYCPPDLPQCPPCPPAPCQPLQGTDGTDTGIWTAVEAGWVSPSWVSKFILLLFFPIPFFFRPFFMRINKQLGECVCTPGGAGLGGRIGGWGLHAGTMPCAACACTATSSAACIRAAGLVPRQTNS